MQQQQEGELVTALMELSGVRKDYTALYGGITEALSDVSLCIRANEILTVVGPSGSGKSTLLRLLAGLEKPTSGSLTTPAHRGSPRIGFVFQANTVFPWRTVQGNLTFPLELRRIPPRQRNETASEICRLVHLDPERFLRKYPKELSGGETRRVAIGMALANESELLLLDEPTSQLDEMTKQRLQKVIYDLSRSHNLPVVLVTHDVSEAVLLGTRILLLWRGKVLDTIPVQLPHPRTDQLIGSPEFTRYRSEVLERFRLAELGDQ